MNYPHGMNNMQLSPAYDHGCHYGYAAPVADYGHGSTFVLIVVLFILLIIVGAAWL